MRSNRPVVESGVIQCGMCGTIYPLGYEHQCGDGKIVVKPPEPDDSEGLVEAAREFLDAYEEDFGDEPWEDPPDRLDAAYLRLRNRLQAQEAGDGDED